MPGLRIRPFAYVIIAGMCGRFTLRTPARDLVEIFELLREPDLTPRFNIAPTQQVLVVRPDNRAREWTSMRWGLVPSWAVRRNSRLRSHRRKLAEPQPRKKR